MAVVATVPIRRLPGVEGGWLSTGDAGDGSSGAGAGALPGGHADVVPNTVRRCERRPLAPTARMVIRYRVAHVRAVNVKRWPRTTATRAPFSTTS
jgi:hypothetical protein